MAKWTTLLLQTSKQCLTWLSFWYFTILACMLHFICCTLDVPAPNTRKPSRQGGSPLTLQNPSFRLLPMNLSRREWQYRVDRLCPMQVSYKHESTMYTNTFELHMNALCYAKDHGRVEPHLVYHVTVLVLGIGTRRKLLPVWCFHCCFELYISHTVKIILHDF